MIEETLIGILRAIIVAFAALGFGKLTSPVMRAANVSVPWRLTLIVLCTMPIFAPTLLTGYAYARWSLPLVHYPWLKEIAYLVLLILKIAPVGALLLFLFPPASSDTARHCMRLMKRSSAGAFPWRSRVSVFVDTYGITFCAAMLLAFHEFEIASLTGIRTWTVRLFDAHAGGTPWIEAVSTAVGPILVQLIFVAALVCGFGWRRSRLVNPVRTVTLAPVSGRILTAWLFAAIATGAVVLLPIILISKEAIAGLGQLANSFALRKEIISSLLFGLSAGFVAFAIAGRLPLRWLGGMAVAGLLGPLIVALGTVRIFQLSWLQSLYDSPIPLIGVLVVLLLPFAFLTQTLRGMRSATDSTFVATQSGALLPRWIMSGRHNSGTVLLLFLLAYSELVGSAILAPPGMTTAPARLYNLMHYGQTAVLSAMVLVVFLVPLLVSCIAFASAEWIARSRWMTGK